MLGRTTTRIWTSLPRSLSRPLPLLAARTSPPRLHRLNLETRTMASTAPQDAPNKGKATQDSWRLPIRAQPEPELKVYNSLTRSKVRSSH